MENTTDNKAFFNAYYDKVYAPVPSRFAAVRLFNKLLTIRTVGWADGEQADACFDGGEWSCPAWENQWQEVIDQTEADIAEMFGMETEDLGHLVMEYDNEWMHHHPAFKTGELRYDAAMMDPEANY